MEIFNLFSLADQLHVAPWDLAKQNLWWHMNGEMYVEGRSILEKRKSTKKG